MPSKEDIQSKMPLKENGAASFNSSHNANTFCRFFSNLADLLLEKLQCPKNKFGTKTTGEFDKHIRNECEDFVLQM